MSETIQQLEAAARKVSAATNNETEVGVRCEAVSLRGAQPKVIYCVTLGDLSGQGKWKWACAHGATLDEAVQGAFQHAANQASDIDREVRELRERALKIGFTLAKLEVTE